MEAKEPVAQVSPQEPHACLGHGEQCPLCARDNDCRVAKGHLYKDACWCHEIIVPKQILDRLAEDTIDPACFCRPCLETIARVSKDLTETNEILAEVRRVILTDRANPVKAEEPDFYLDADGNTVPPQARKLLRQSVPALSVLKSVILSLSKDQFSL